MYPIPTITLPHSHHFPSPTLEAAVPRQPTTTIIIYTLNPRPPPLPHLHKGLQPQGCVGFISHQGASVVLASGKGAICLGQRGASKLWVRVLVLDERTRVKTGNRGGGDAEG
ncbi:hypothetical protein Tco_0529969 [Tanacetum coccineum]